MAYICKGSIVKRMGRTTIPLTRHHKTFQRRLIRDNRIGQRERADGELVHVRRGRRRGARGEDDLGEVRGDADVGMVADDFVVLGKGLVTRRARTCLLIGYGRW